MLIINIGIAVGAGLYEHRVVVSNWITSTPEGLHWNRDRAQRDDPGRKFWAYVTTLPLTIIAFANLFAAWGAPSAVRGWWLATAIAVLLDRVFTFTYFIPTMVGLLRSPDSPAAVAAAVRWSNLNYARHAIVLTAWLAALKTFALVHQHRW
jgi:hypothetical protein